MQYKSRTDLDLLSTTEKNKKPNFLTANKFSKAVKQGHKLVCFINLLNFGLLEHPTFYTCKGKAGFPTSAQRVDLKALHQYF